MNAFRHTPLPRVVTATLLTVALAYAASSCARGQTGDSSDDSCGNRFIEGTEECDDGNHIDGDGCDADCTLTCSIAGSEVGCSDYAPCNGIERCTTEHTCAPATALPDGASCGNDSVCSAGQCKPAAVVCGDGVVVKPSEDCEDGNTASGDGCFDCRWECWTGNEAQQCHSNDCRAPGACDPALHACSEGPLMPDGSECRVDPAQPSGPENIGVCRAGACAKASCGNDTVEPGEECDDGNAVAGDGCDNDCRFSCVGSDPSRSCATGDLCKGKSTCDDATHTCSVPTPLKPGDDCGSSATVTKYCKAQAGSVVCTIAQCGNRLKEPKEECDDGNTTDSDGCRSNCTYTCETAAECDDAKRCSKDDCDTSTHTCKYSADSAQVGQSCSESGVVSGRCIAGVCAPPGCGDGYKDASEDCDLKDLNGTGLGCTASCRFECSSTAACQDGNPCNGAETCESTPAGGKRCTNPADLSDGTVCQNSPRQICRAGSCVASSCGDGYVDSGAGEQCEPPKTSTCTATCQTPCDLSGMWAVSLSADVRWGGTLLYNDGSGSVRSYGLVTRTHSATEQKDSFVPCGLALPDFRGTGLTFADRYGLTFDAALFDRALPASSAAYALSNPSAGGSFESLAPLSTFLGLAPLNPVTQPWPALGDITQVDHDANGQPGVTARAKSGSAPGGGSYTGLWLGFFDRADQVYLALREVVTFAGTLDSCTAIHGNATVTALNTHVLGCHVAGGAGCSSSQRDLLDDQRLRYQVTGATFKMQKISAPTSCAAVRAALP